MRELVARSHAALLRQSSSNLLYRSFSSSSKSKAKRFKRVKEDDTAESEDGTTVVTKTVEQVQELFNKNKIRVGIDAASASFRPDAQKMAQALLDIYKKQEDDFISDYSKLTTQAGGPSYIPPRYEVSVVPPYSSSEERDKLVTEYNFLLHLTPKGLGLQHIDGITFSKTLLTHYSLQNDANFSRFYFRHGENMKSPLVRSVTVKDMRPSDTYIIDATGGLARDAYVFACVGFRVTIIEKDPIIFLLLQDALDRAKKSPEHGPIVNKMNLINKDSLQYLPTLSIEDRPDVMYIDPFYPSRKKVTSANQKEMSVIRSLVKTESNTLELIKLARETAKRKAVLKRPYYVGVHPEANHCFRSTNTHYDVFVPGSPSLSNTTET